LDEEVAGEGGSGGASEVSLPTDPTLAHLADELRRSRLAAELFDPSWNLVWVSEELKSLLGTRDEKRIGYGSHILEARTNELWSNAATEEAQYEWGMANIAYVLHETPDEVLGSLALGSTPQFPDDIEPAPAPPAWSYEIDYRRPGFQPMRITCMAVRINDRDGSRIGTANVYAPALPATILDLIARGDESMYERMARLVEPGRRPAAILFADLQASGPLSRRLPSATFFELIRALTTAIDEVVGRCGGVVGKHAGDGVTAFFLADQLGTPSSAARAALEAARGIGEAAAAVAAGVAADGAPIESRDVAMNVGVHWAGALYMGQVVTGGRLEVTALGDEVNECARIQQSARDGAGFASKTILEQLSREDAEALGIDPDRTTYRTVAELPGATGKSIRDAGGIAVADLPGAGSPEPGT
jgi:class 3 adenylate cyclase